MTWHTVTIPTDELNQFLLTIRREGAQVCHCFPCSEGHRVIYTTVQEPNR